MAVIEVHSTGILASDTKNSEDAVARSNSGDTILFRPTVKELNGHWEWTGTNRVLTNNTGDLPLAEETHLNHPEAFGPVIPSGRFRCNATLHLGEDDEGYHIYSVKPNSDVLLAPRFIIPPEDHPNWVEARKLIKRHGLDEEDYLWNDGGPLSHLKIEDSYPTGVGKTWIKIHFVFGIVEAQKAD